MLLCSINASRLTTLIIAGCENVTDTFLLTCFLANQSVKMNSSSSSKSLVSSDQRSYGACAAVDRWNAVGQCGSASACGRDVCATASLNCAPRHAVDHNGHCRASPATGYSTAAASGGRPAENCGRFSDWSTATSCSRLAAHSQDSTNTLYRLEHLDVSGCWRITDLSITYVFNVFVDVISAL